jgi:hypothetical protein
LGYLLHQFDHADSLSDKSRVVTKYERPAESLTVKAKRVPACAHVTPALCICTGAASARTRGHSLAHAAGDASMTALESTHVWLCTVR